MTKQSRAYTLFGDLDGMTVADLRALLDGYPDDAVIDAQSELEYGSDQEKEFFVIKTKEEV